MKSLGAGAGAVGSADMKRANCGIAAGDATPQFSAPPGRK
jgi:hypothetical protein